MPDDDEPPPPPKTTLQYRSGLDEPATEWREGFDLIELLVENLLGLFFAACGLVIGALGVRALAVSLLARGYKHDPLTAFAVFSFTGAAAVILFFLAGQFIGLRPRR